MLNWNRLVHLLLPVAFLGFALPCAHATNYLFGAGKYNVFVQNYFNYTGPDSVGAVAAGGNMAITGASVSLASGYNTANFPYYSVVAGGTLSCPNTCIADGNIHAAAESGTIYNNYSGGTNTVNSTQVIDFANNFAELKGLSTWLTAQTTTSGDSCSYNSASNTLTCTGTKAGLNVINIPTTGTVNAGLLGTANLEFTTTVSGATLVLNVAGASSALGTSYGFKATDKQKVLFNYSATSLTLGGTIDASVLAPWANVVTAAGASGQFTGNLIAQSFAGGGLEFENNLFNGDIPEPGTFVLMSAGLLLAVAARRRAKRPTA